MAYQNMISKNPLVNNFNTFQTNNSCKMPFESNSLIKENIHVMNHANYALQMQRMQQGNQVQMGNQRGIGQSGKTARDPFERRNLGGNPDPNGSGDDHMVPSANIRGGKGVNLIKEMLKPQKIAYNNKDVLPSVKSRKNENKKSIDPTNVPYKIIMTDRIGKILEKKWKDVKEDDILVHKTTEADKDSKRLTEERKAKKLKMKEINNELEVEYCLANMDKHKEKYEYNQTVIRNLAHEESKTDNDSRADYVEFYKKKLTEDERGQERSDSVLRKLIDTGIIRPEELPTMDDAPSEESMPKSINTEVFEKKISKPIVDKPVVKKPVVGKPIVSKPVVEKPAVSKAVVEKPAVSKPVVVEKPAVSKPAVSKPAVSKPVVSKPAVSKPVVDKPAIISKPVVNKTLPRSVGKPIVSKPTITKPTISNPQ